MDGLLEISCSLVGWLMIDLIGSPTPYNTNTNTNTNTTGAAPNAPGSKKSKLF
jgi:hypothetical protein